jgi:hypothetical protein
VTVRGVCEITGSESHAGTGRTASQYIEFSVLQILTYRGFQEETRWRTNYQNFPTRTTRSSPISTRGRWRFITASITRPIKELKGFEKISLKAGESKTVRFTVDAELLSYFGRDKKWVTDPGKFQLFIGGDSVDLQQIEFEYE